MYPILVYRTEADGEDALTPKGWTQRFYKLNNGDFRFAKWTLDLSDDLFIEDPNLIEGSLRINGKIDAGRLFIGVFDKTEDYKLLGAEAAGRMMTISFDGSEWDMVAEAPGSAITFHADRAIADRVLTADTKALLKSKMQTDGKSISLLLPVTPNAELLADMMKKYLLIAQQTDFLKEEPDHLTRVIETLTSLAESVIDDILHIEPVNKQIERNRRIRIANGIEDLLWRNVEDGHDPAISIDDVAAQFGVSRRTVQLAIEETFDTSYTNLRRLIRLYQARAVIDRDLSRNAITKAAVAHGFDHTGRFSRHYKEFFGALPSQQKKTRSPK